MRHVLPLWRTKGQLQAGTPGEARGVIQSKSKGQRTRVLMGANPSARAGEDWCPSSSKQAGIKNGVNSLFSSFCSIQDLNKLDDAWLHGRGPSALLSPPIQRLILPRNTLTDIPRNDVRSGQLMASQLTQNSAGIKLPASFLKMLKIEIALWTSNSTVSLFTQRKWKH